MVMATMKPGESHGNLQGCTGREGPGSLHQEDDTMCHAERHRDERAAKERAVLDLAPSIARWLEIVELAGLPKETEAFIAAVDAFTASKAVKPEDLKPGQRFRFETWPIEDSAIVVFDALTQQKRWMVESDSAVYHFDPERGVIPIEDSEP